MELLYQNVQILMAWNVRKSFDRQLDYIGFSFQEALQYNKNRLRQKFVENQSTFNKINR